MSEVLISPRAYTKMIFHAAKYPHFAVNGILLGEKKSDNSTKPILRVLDAIPLFHQCLYVTPMAEIALTQIEVMAAENDMQIIGYYAATENFNNSTIDKVPAIKIADKIAENNSGGCFIMIDNRFVTLNQETPAIKCWQNIDGKWSKSSFILDNIDTTLEAISELLQRGAMKDIVDFDNYLDNPENDWTNGYLDRDLEQLMAMY